MVGKINPVAFNISADCHDSIKLVVAPTYPTGSHEDWLASTLRDHWLLALKLAVILTHLADDFGDPCLTANQNGQVKCMFIQILYRKITGRDSSASITNGSVRPKKLFPRINEIVYMPLNPLIGSKCPNVNGC